VYLCFLTTETECVYCAVRNKYLYIIPVNFRLYSRTMAEAVSRRSITAEARVQYQVVYMRSVAGKVSLGQVFLPVISYCPVGIIPPMVHTDLHPHVALNKTNGEVWKPSKSNSPSKIREHQKSTLAVSSERNHQCYYPPPPPRSQTLSAQVTEPLRIQVQKKIHQNFFPSPLQKPQITTRSTNP
jgi:hypothetical protein